ncbi:MAG: GNAT family N-acetyltransferase [Myxococcota bacterium]
MTRYVRVVRGTCEETAARAHALLEGFDAVLDVGDPGELRRWLGTSQQAVVLDGHQPLPAEAYGQAQGLVRGGGVLVLRLPRDGVGPADPRLAVPPFGPGDVGLRFARRVVAALEAVALPEGAPPTPPPGPPPSQGTGEQAFVVESLQDGLVEPAHCAMLTARRGRGKSSALGLALRGFPGRVWLTALHARSVAELLRFAQRSDLRHRLPEPLLLSDEEPPDLIVVDEAAALSLAWLQQLVERFVDTHLWFATTTEGYEGTGRGFALRFGRWLADRRPLQRYVLDTPIRWGPDDPVEEALTDALLLSPGDPPRPIGTAELRHQVWDRDALAADEPTLRAIFGLLVHAHYRTTPGDLHRMLDAPNLRVHTLHRGASVVAASLVALEGPLDGSTVDALVEGRRRLRGQALPETLVSHAGVREAGALRFVRSVRIVTHPGYRRAGAARTLVDAIHDHHAPDAFGTLFGATSGVVRFRQAVGYTLVRLGAARGARTGDPAVVMVRPVTDAATRVVDRLRERLAARLRAQIALLRADEAGPVDDALVAALLEGVPATPPPLPEAEVIEGVRAYAFGPRPLESVIVELRRFGAHHAAVLAGAPPEDRARIEARVEHGRPWWRLAQARGTSIPTEMRATRRAYSAFARRARPDVFGVDDR